MPLKDLVNKFSHLRFEPAGFTGNRDIPMAKSLVDYVFRYMATKFMSADEKTAVGIINRQLTLSDAKVVSGEASGDAPNASRSASSASAPPPAAATRTDSGPTRSAEGGEATTRASDPAASSGGEAPEAAGEQGTSGIASIPVGSDAPVKDQVDLDVESAARSLGLLDGLKIVAQNAESKDRAERLAVGQAPVVFDTADSPACTDCGSIMVRNGSCYKCINCGATSGCS